MCQGDDASILKETSVAYGKLNYDEARLKDTVDRGRESIEEIAQAIAHIVKIEKISCSGEPGRDPLRDWRDRRKQRLPTYRPNYGRAGPPKLGNRRIS
ncbi:uncharacterized protein J4E79_010406 [Alternaria viburni]|uniref:uncharacterized protein n=1 Tax=Alternaria viburni TaxID=566460 RepID=UPI0020C5612F|nr:uncharacterized protein J4E79_010406 [Alternaria viburni]KAI4647254.1 hypothetical protein J4E79_010406 [Alternaria viburni]